MLDQKLHILGYDDLVLMFGLLGIEGTVIESDESFSEKFKNLVRDNSIGMIIIGLELSPIDLDYLLNFKLNNKQPLIFILPDVFRYEFDKADVIKNKIIDSIGEILSK